MSWCYVNPITAKHFGQSVPKQTQIVIGKFIFVNIFCFRFCKARGFATQAHPKVNSSNHADVYVTTLPNQLVVASVDANSPISRVSIAFRYVFIFFIYSIQDIPLRSIVYFLNSFSRAGSREETYENLGTTHVLRATVLDLSNRRSTAFGVTRNIQAVGGSISAKSDREMIAYDVVLKRDSLETGLKFLQDVSIEHVFKPWELETQTARIQRDLARVPPNVRAVDLLHRAAFRTQLGNSPFCAKHHIGKISPECLQHYVATNFTANRGVVVGVGIDHQYLVGYANNLHLEDRTADKSVASKFFGGELRVDKAGQLASVAVGTQGAALSNQKEALAFAVLQQAAGVGPNIRRAGPNGALGKAVSGSFSSPIVLSALNESYTDNGLFGFVLTGNGREIGKVKKIESVPAPSGMSIENFLSFSLRSLKMLWRRWKRDQYRRPM